MLPWALCILAAAAAAVLAVRLWLLRRALDELGRQVEARLGEDTNNLLFLSTRDRAVRRLAARLSTQLRALRQARLRYEQGDRLLKEAVTGVSHDLRTPLTAASGYLELLEREDLPPAAKRYCSLIAGRIQAMTQLTEELLRCSLGLSAGDPLHPEAVDLGAAVEEALLAFYGALTQRGITPAVRLPEEKVVRQLDRAALSRILGNLLHNAIKYSAGDLTVDLSPDGTLTLANAAPSLDEVRVGRLFDRFFTVETAGQATGLGLSIARQLTERLHGTLEARYADGRLCMALRFPEK